MYGMNNAALMLAAAGYPHFVSGGTPQIISGGTPNIVGQAANQGWVPYQDAYGNQFLWDGSSWVKTSGANVDFPVGALPNMEVSKVLQRGLQSLAQESRAATVRRDLGQTIAERSSVAVVDQPFRDKRVSDVGFGRTPILAGQTISIVTLPQRVFKGERLFIPSDIAGTVAINDLKVGNQSQFMNGNSIPGRRYSEISFGPNLDLDTADISQTIELIVFNFGLNDIVFMASISGISVK